MHAEEHFLTSLKLASSEPETNEDQATKEKMKVTDEEEPSSDPSAASLAASNARERSNYLTEHFAQKGSTDTAVRSHLSLNFANVARGTHTTRSLQFQPGAATKTAAPRTPTRLEQTLKVLGRV